MLKFIITCIAFDLYPGVNFFYVGNITIKRGFMAGFYIAIGMAVCDFLSGLFAVFGLLKIMEMNSYIRLAMRIGSCSYFLYLTVSNFLASFKMDKLNTNQEDKEQNVKNFILKGFLVAITNPGIVMGDALVILQFTHEFSFIKQLFYIVLFAIISFACFVLVSFIFSRKKFRQKVVQKDYYLKRFSSLVMGFIFYSIFKDLVLDFKELIFN